MVGLVRSLLFVAVFVLCSTTSAFAQAEQSGEDLAPNAIRSWQEFEAAKERARQADPPKPILIYLSGHPWCGGCKRLEEKVLQAEGEVFDDFRGFLDSEFERVQVNLTSPSPIDPTVDGSFEWEFFLAYGVTGTPRLIIADSVGAPAAYFTGVGIDPELGPTNGNEYVEHFQQVYQAGDNTVVDQLRSKLDGVRPSIAFGPSESGMQELLRFLAPKNVPIFDYPTYATIAATLEVDPSDVMYRAAYMQHWSHVFTADLYLNYRVGQYGADDVAKDPQQLRRELGVPTSQELAEKDLSEVIDQLNINDTGHRFSASEEDQLQRLLATHAKRLIAAGAHAEASFFISEHLYADEPQLARPWVRGHRIEMLFLYAKALWDGEDDKSKAKKLAGDAVEEALMRAEDQESDEAKYVEPSLLEEIRALHQQVHG